MLDLITRLRLTPLNDLHLSRGGRLVPFAGWSLPVQFPAGIIAEVHQCRRAAALFDVSHMAQIELHGAHGDAALERLLPADLLELPEGRQVYTQLLNEAGGIIDDLMVGRLAGGLRLVVNASRATVDLAHLRAALPASITLIPRDDLALLALQGPRAAAALDRLVPNVAALPFMGVGRFRCSGFDTVIARCGYTGEDGFEIALPADRATDFAEQLLALPDVAPAGLGARDALRLEAGLCLHGQDIDDATTPIEAGLAWSIGKRRRRDGCFPGDTRIGTQIANGPSRRLVGLRPDGRAPVRTGAAILSHEQAAVGHITSGAFSPTLNAPIALGYVQTPTPAAVTLMLRDRPVAASLSKLPFVPKHYAKQTEIAA
jgi:aminomethyltransferase